MALYKVADGILETHVTWEDIEEELQKTFNTTATFGAKKTARNISDLKGFTSKIALIEADWQNVEQGKVLPKNCAVKICSQLPYMAFSKVLKYTDENGFEDQKLKSLEKNLREAHNREIDAYKLLEKFNHTDVPFTKVYGLKPFASESDLKGFIIMEYIPDIFTTSMAETLFVDDLIPTIKGVSTFAALGHKLSDDEKSVAVCGGYLEGYFNTFLGPASIESTFQNLSQAFSFLEPSKAEKLVEVYRHYLKILNKFTRISEILGFHQIFNHGDLWQSNMLYKTGTNGKLELKAIIDWQGLSLLPPAFDMTRLFIGCLSPEDRRQRAPELLKIFHETFVHVLGEELFSYQEVYDSYNLHFPLMSLMVLPGMVQFLDAPHLEEPEKSALKMRTMKNMEAIMEDVFVAP